MHQCNPRIHRLEWTASCQFPLVDGVDGWIGGEPIPKLRWLPNRGRGIGVPGSDIEIKLMLSYTSVALGAIIQPAWKSKVMVIEFEFKAESPDESARIVVSEPENQERLEAAGTLLDPYPTGQHSGWSLSSGKVSLGGPF